MSLTLKTASNQHRIKFSQAEGGDLGQDEAYFFLTEGDHEKKLRFHDYNEIYSRRGLYEQVFYERLKCTSPKKVGEILKRALDASEKSIMELRVLDLGAGNGMMGEVLRSYGVSRLVGVDIIPEALEAADRDRPGTYDQYYVEDFCSLTEESRENLNDWSFNCLTSVAALGFGDIPVSAFFEAINLVQDGGWVAFNIKETFLDSSDDSGFSRFIRELIFSEYLDVHHLERYRHRLSMEGVPLFYYGLVAQKTASIPRDLMTKCGIE
jgi:SAM-dependent methyltransferase